jgi:hypothetical protein
VQVHYSTSECRNRVPEADPSLSLHCQVILCKGVGNFQSIVPHIRSFLCNIGSSPYFGSSIHWKFFMLKAKKELYKTDKERMQVNRLLDIDSHPWCFVSVLKSSFEACCIHWTPLMLSFELVNQTRKASLPAWMFSNLEKRTTSVELILVDYLLNSYSRSQTLNTFGEGASLNWRRTYTFSRYWREPKTWRDSFIYFL